jgi:hypothetical protein
MHWSFFREVVRAEVCRQCMHPILGEEREVRGGFE